MPQQPITHEDVAQAFADHHHDVSRVLAARTHRPVSDPIVEDAVMTAWMRLTVQAEQGKTITEVRAWMNVAAWWEFLRIVRATRPTEELDDDQPAPRAQDVTARAGEARAEHDALRRLPNERDRRILSAHLAGFTYDEIAAAVGISSSRAFKLAARARRALRDAGWR